MFGLIVAWLQQECYINLSMKLSKYLWIESNYSAV